MQAGIIGLGLIGGSLGLALKNTKIFKEIKGFDNNPIHSKQALNLGLIDECVSLEELSDCDIVFIAIPLNSVIKCLNAFNDIKPGFTIVDLGSSKHKIIEEIPEAFKKHYISIHPMAGTEFSGPKAARDDLFKNKIAIFIESNCGDFQLAFAKEIFLNLGMQIVRMDSKSHDKHIAYISHLPHILSFTLANTVLNQEKPEDFLSLIGGGFRSMIRLANSSSITWSDIFEYNRDFLLDSLKDFRVNLDEVEDILKNSDWENLKEFILKSNKIHEFL